MHFLSETVFMIRTTKHATNSFSEINLLPTNYWRKQIVKHLARSYVFSILYAHVKNTEEINVIYVC